MSGTVRTNGKPRSGLGTVIGRLSSAIRNLVPPPGPARPLALQSLMFALGMGTFLAGSTVFFTRALGLTSTQIGVGLSLTAAVSSIATLPLGVLIDKVDAKRVWLFSSLAQVALFALYPFASGYAAFLVLVTALALVRTISGLAVGVYSIGALPEGERVRGQAYQRSAQNIGVTAGGGMAAVAMAVDTVQAYRIMLWTVAALLAFALVFVGRLPSLPRSAPRPRARRHYFAVLRQPSVLLASGLVGALGGHQVILMVILPLWVMDHTDAPLPTVAGLFAANTVLVVLLQVKASAGAETASGAARALRQAGLLIALSCLAFASAVWADGIVTVLVLAAGAVVLTIGEMRDSAGAWGVTASLAPPDRRGEYVGAFNLGAQLLNLGAPAVLTIVVLGIGGWGWLVVAGWFVLASVVAGPTIAWAERTVTTVADERRAAREHTGRETNVGGEHA